MKPESVGMCSQRLARIDRFLAQRYVDSGRLPCALLQVSRNGQLVHQSVLGKASLEAGTPLTDDSIVRVRSMTKPITSVAMMMLVEQGLVALDDPVHLHIPAWRDLAVYVAGGSGLPGAPAGWQTKPVEAPMRIIDLLRHTSGLTYGFQSRTNVDAAYRANKIDALERDDGLDGFIDALTKVPLEFSPGTAWNYSVSTDVLGFLVSKISGLAFDDFCASTSSARWACKTPTSSSPPTRLLGWRSATCEAPTESWRRCRAAASWSRRPRLRAAVGWSPPQPTTCAFVNACAAAARSTKFG